MIGLKELAKAVEESAAEMEAGKGTDEDPIALMLRRRGVDPAALAHFALRHAGAVSDVEAVALAAVVFVSAFELGLRVGATQPKGVYAVLRHADAGETEVLMLHTSEDDADELAAWVNGNEAPGYTATVSFEPVDDRELVEAFKRERRP